MGEGKGGVKAKSDVKAKDETKPGDGAKPDENQPDAKAKPDTKASPGEIEREVESIRDRLDPVIEELDIRRHELTDWRLQLERHGPTLLKVGAVLAGAVVGVSVVRRLPHRWGQRRRKPVAMDF